MKKLTLLFILLVTSYILNAQNRENMPITDKERYLKEYQLQHEEEIYLQQLREKSNLKSFKVAANEQDSLALIALYNATGGSYWNNNTGWLTDSVTNWFGITLDENGRVTRIYFNDNNLHGSIPSEIGNLTALTYLSLDNNPLTSLPAEIGNLAALTHLSFYINQLSSIPPEIGNLTALTHLYLSKNQLTNIPPEIGNLTALTHLTLWGNRLTVIPPEIGNLTALTFLLLNGLQLTSIPPEIGNLTALTYLRLDGNRLTNIPPEIGNLTALTNLSFFNNQLTSIPPELGNLTALTHLELNYNLLKSIPVEIGNLTVLTDFWLNNNQLTNIPEEIGNLTSLSFFSLINNQLTSLPDLSGLTSLNAFYVYGNNLDFGDLEIINVNWANMSDAEYSPQTKIGLLQIKNNGQLVLSVSVDGTNNVYEWFKNDTLMSGETKDSLIIPDVNLSKYNCLVTNPDFPNLILNSENIYLPFDVSKEDYDALVALYNATNGGNWINNTNWLSNNPVNKWYGISVSSGRVAKVNLNDNNLYGIISYWIGDLSNLNILDLSGNRLSGNIPSHLKYLKKLKKLVLNDNQFKYLPKLYFSRRPDTVSVANNKLTFKDIEPNIWIASVDFNYSPQAKVGETKEVYSELGNSVHLVVEVGSGHNIYQWFKDGTEIADSNNDTLSIISCSSGDVGTYYCKITNSIATDLSLESEPIYLMLTSINDNLKEQLNIYPNPTNGQFNINLDEMPGQDGHLEIMDLNGKIIYRQKLVKAQNQISLDDKPEGIYILQITGKNKVYVKSKILLVK